MGSAKTTLQYRIRRGKETAPPWRAFATAVRPVEIDAAFVSLECGSPFMANQSNDFFPSDHPAPADAAGVFPVSPGSGVPAGSERWTWHEQTLHVPGLSGASGIVRNVVTPTVTMSEAAPGKAAGTSLIVAPGGPFRFLLMDSEGYDLARWLARLGVTAFVLKYRLAQMPEDDVDMLALMPSLFRSLPRQDPTEEAPPVGDEAMEAARSWAEEDVAGILHLQASSRSKSASSRFHARSACALS
jgi:hypothetical protein